MNKLRQLTQLYRRFYRVKSSDAKADVVLKPINEAADVVLGTEFLINLESLIDAVAARLIKLMKDVRRRAAEGEPALTPEKERQAIYDFAKYFVEVIFDGSFQCDQARLARTQLDLIGDTCDYLYRREEDKERQERKQPSKQPRPDEIPDLEAK